MSSRIRVDRVRALITQVDCFSYGVVLWEIITKERSQRGNWRPVRVPEECPAEVEALLRVRRLVDTGAGSEHADGQPFSHDTSHHVHAYCRESTPTTAQVCCRGFRSPVCSATVLLMGSVFTW